MTIQNLQLSSTYERNSFLFNYRQKYYKIRVLFASHPVNNLPLRIKQPIYYKMEIVRICVGKSHLLNKTNLLSFSLSFHWKYCVPLLHTLFWALTGSGCWLKCWTFSHWRGGGSQYDRAVKWPGSKTGSGNMQNYFIYSLEYSHESILMITLPDWKWLWSPGGVWFGKSTKFDPFVDVCNRIHSPNWKKKINLNIFIPNPI